MVPLKDNVSVRLRSVLEVLHPHWTLCVESIFMVRREPGRESRWMAAYV